MPPPLYPLQLYPCPPLADRLVRACAELPKLCEFFHIPFQSGDDDVLREMKRGYTAERCAASLPLPWLTCVRMLWLPATAVRTHAMCQTA